MAFRITGPIDDVGLPPAPVKRLDQLRKLVRGGEASRQARNEEHVELQRSKHAELFTGLLGFSLNPQQVAAILHDEDRALVVAGAGTGKTSTIVGKATYLLKEGLAKPSDILLLAFTRDAAKEMKKRLAKELAVTTFHALGLQVIAQATRKMPSLSRMAEDPASLSRAIRQFLAELLEEPNHRNTLVEFLAYFRYPYRAIETFQNQHQYHQYIAGHNVRTLRGEKVKSVEECVIANWLTLHGIRYEYERSYEYDTASIEFRQYRPDFYLTDFGIYIEHFGINRQGRPPPFFDDPEGYLEGMAWKRDLHKSMGTQLIETYSYWASEGQLYAELEILLTQAKVPIGTIESNELSDLIQNDDSRDPFVDLVTSFLNLYKGNAWTSTEVRDRVDAANDIRAKKFLPVFEAIYARYEQLLAKEKAIDFADMINQAVDHVKAGHYTPGYRYILVDEFQDISRGRAQLIHALQKQIEGSKLFVVGDDWQSIYRFTGSDIDLMTRFQEHFGFTRRTDLQETHRFNDKLLQASSKFILANPQQLSKQLLAQTASEVPAIEIVSELRNGTAAQPGSDKLLISVLEEIASENRQPQIDVLILGRYHHILDRYRHVRIDDSRLILQFKTVHQAKGTEADYAIVLNVVGGRYGFPTEIVDDPLIDLVLSGRGPFPNAEERRLFYVAITRAKHKSFVLTLDAERSVFVDELESDAFIDLVIPSDAVNRSAMCPICKGGRFVSRAGPWGAFWSCSNYPLCDAKALVCPWCGEGAFVAGAESYTCSNENCRRTAPVCPVCKVGAVVPRTGPYGQFYGCTEWRPSGASCPYKKPFQQSM